MARLNRKRGRKSKYVRSLNNQYWREVRQMVMSRDKGECQICGSILYLEVHHLTYKAPDSTNIQGKEKDCLERLILLCSCCHEKVHKNKNHKFNPQNYYK